MPVTDVEDAESAEAIDVLAAVHVGEDVAVIRPFDGGRSGLTCGRFAIVEKTGVDVIAKPFDGFVDDPIGLRAIDRGRVDEV
jgi:hypothetical protein